MAARPPKAPTAPACTLVIFGAAGDLTKRLLVPAIYNLASDDLLSKDFRILGVDRIDGDDASLRQGLGKFLHDIAADKNSEFGLATINEAAWSGLAARIFYQKADVEDEASYDALTTRLKALGPTSVIFYLAVAPRFFNVIIERLSKAGLLAEPAGGFRRVVIEKPFGSDVATAKALNAQILAHMGESQIYRIDHFLGKETVRNIMVTRFGNGVFEPLWNARHIDSVQITAAETVGVEARGAYYEGAGALKDMVPNHLFQLLTMVAMEPPNSFAPEAVRAEKGRVIEAIRTLTPSEAAEDSVRGQYTDGEVSGRAMKGYRQSPGVDPKSQVETYVALKLEIDNWRWAGVPFYLRTGKALSAHDTHIAIQFKAAPRTLFQNLPTGASTPNVLNLQIQPHEGLSLFFDAKRPGPDVDLADVKMEFRYADAFGHQPATGYETLIYDVMIGDQTLFKRGDDIEFAWKAVEPFMQAWKKGSEVEAYPAGSEGPQGADALLARDGRAWRPLRT